MKKMRFNIQNIYLKLLRNILTLLGIVTLTSCPAMYAPQDFMAPTDPEPQASHKVFGKITNEDNKPIKDILIYATSKAKVGDVTNDLISQYASSNSSGDYILYVNKDKVGYEVNSFTVNFADIDGNYNELYESAIKKITIISGTSDYSANMTLTKQ